MAADTDGIDPLRLVVALLAAFVLLPVVVMALMVPTMGMMGGWWMDGGSVGPRTGWALLVPVVWVVVLFVAGWLAYRAVTRRRMEGRDPALRELRKSYARGDLTTEEYEERREALREE